MYESLELRQLEAFAAVMSTGSITASAQLLGRSQPGVTRQIQELEAALGFALFDRARRGVAPTERGARFHAEVERHLASLRQLHARAAHIRQDGAATLDVAAIPAFSAGLLAAAMARVAGVANMPIHLRAEGGAEVVRLVLERVSDLGLCSLPLRSPGLVVHWVAEVPCVAVLRADDPLAAQETVPLAALQGRRLITTANPYRLDRHVDAALSAAGVSRQVPFDANTSFSALGAVRAGLGVALIEPLTPAGAPLEGLVTRPIDRRLPFRYGAITAAGRPSLPAPVVTMLAALEAEMRQRIPGLTMLSPDATEILA
jgi:DNA-binding transcriptional LysR family regulator